MPLHRPANGHSERDNQTFRPSRSEDRAGGPDNRASLLSKVFLQLIPANEASSNIRLKLAFLPLTVKRLFELKEKKPAWNGGQGVRSSYALTAYEFPHRDEPPHH